MQRPDFCLERLQSLDPVVKAMLAGIVMWCIVYVILRYLKDDLEALFSRNIAEDTVSGR